MNDPIPPENRRMIYVAGAEDALGFRRDADLHDLAEDHETAIVPFESDSPLASLLRGQNVLRPGLLLIQSPYAPDKYVPVDDAIRSFTVEKFAILSQVAMNLGAKKVTVDKVDTETTERTRKLKAKANTPLTTSTAEVKAHLKESLESSLKITQTFAGGAPDAQAALARLRGANLLGDTELTNLVELRSSSNPVTTSTTKLSISRDTNRSFEVALNFSAGRSKLKLSGFSVDLEEQIQQRLTATITTTIQF